MLKDFSFRIKIVSFQLLDKYIKLSSNGKDIILIRKEKPSIYKYMFAYIHLYIYEVKEIIVCTVHY